MRNRKLSTDYREVYEQGSSIPQQDDREELEYYSSLIDHSLPLRILDLGCAEGKLVEMLAGKGHFVTGLDIAPSHVRKTAENARQANLEVTCVECDIEKDTGDLSGKVFDIIYCMDVIEHFRNPVSALENMHSLLAEDGLLIIDTPNCLAVSRILRYLLKPRSLVDYSKLDSLRDLHFQTYDYLTLEKTMNFVGFKVEEAVANTLSLPKTWRLKRFAGLRHTLSKCFPLLSDNLLLRCRKSKPLDVTQQIGYWRQEYEQGQLKI